MRKIFIKLFEDDNHISAVTLKNVETNLSLPKWQQKSHLSTNLHVGWLTAK